MTAKLVKHRALILGLLVVGSTFQLSCGSEKPKDLTLTGTVYAARGPLVGYKLKCLTLTKPTYTGTATVDGDGKFSVVFAASNVPFGCFVLNTSDTQVASVFFTSSTESATSQTIKISGSTDVGAIVVNETRGTATATTTAATSKNPGELECPVGVWTQSVGVNSDCPVSAVAPSVDSTIWVGKDSEGKYIVSMAWSTYKQTTCGLSAFAPTGAATYSNNTLTWDTRIGSYTGSVVAEVATDCSKMSLQVTQNGCGTCATGGAAADLATTCSGSNGAAAACVSSTFLNFTRK